MITFPDYFYSKYYYGRLAASANAKGEAMGPAQFRSLDFNKRNGYLKDPARFRSLDFGERNRYLKDVAPIYA